MGFSLARRQQVIEFPPKALDWNLASRPRRLIWLAAFAVLVLIAVCVSSLRTEPWLPGEPVFTAVQHSDKTVHRGINALRRSEAESWFELIPADLTSEPDDFATFDEYDRFLDRQNQISRLLQGDVVQLRRVDGSWIEVQPIVPRPLETIPTRFWYQCLLAVVAVLFGIGGLAFRFDSWAARFYAISGTGVALIILPAATYGSRQLALPGDTIAAWSWLQQLGTWVFAFGGVSMLTVYPRQILFRHAWMLVAAATAFPLLAFSFRWSSIHFTVNVPIVACFALFSSLAILQWRSSKNSPLDRAGLRWYLTVLLVGVAALLATMSAPVFLTGEALIPQAYAWTFLVAIFVGEFVGVFRYRIFELEPWYAHVWLWLLFGLGIAVIDSMLILWVGLDARPTLLLTLLFMGWVYFPARQWLTGILMPGWSHSTVDRALPWLLERALDSGSGLSLDERLGRTAAEWFRPLQLERVAVQHAPEVEIALEGQLLRIPGLSGNEVWELQHADGGQRLFVQNDIDTGRSIRELFSAALRLQRAFGRGVEQERKRLARDLHDDVSGHMLQIVHQAQDPEIEGLAREALNEIRHMVTSLEGRDKNLAAALAQWRLEFIERLTRAQGAVEWDVDAVNKTFELSTRQFLNLRSVLRELASNALKHSLRPKIRVRWTSGDRALGLVVQCSGGSPTSEAEGSAGDGLGLRNIRSRVEELGGVVSMHASPSSDSVQWSLEMEIPIEPQERENREATDR